MRYLYVDNFRGFSDTYIPIKDVNFLVGENSTGKTSILSLIHRLSSPRFWFNQEFNTDEVQLGHFEDIVSVNSANKGYFRIGVIECADGDDETKPTDTGAFLLTFVKEKGLPVIQRYRGILEEEQVEAIFSEKLIRYKISPLEFCGELEDDILRTFKQWVSESDKREQDFRQIKIDQVLASRTEALAYFMTFIRLSREDGERFFLPQEKIPVFTYPLGWIAPIRSKPKTTYDSYKLAPTPEGDHTPYVIKRLLSGRSTRESFQSFIEAFGAESGLFESVYTREYGKESTAPFELGVVIGGFPLKLIYVGYGISQVLPVIVELFADRLGRWFAIQQPEVHLHPKAQAALGDIFYKIATDENKRFFIETHSDYIIDRFRLNFRSGKGETEIDSQVLFFERSGAENRVHCIEIEQDGEYSEDQPRSFREFFIHEDLRLLGL